MRTLLLIFMLCFFYIASASTGGHGGDGWLDSNGKPYLYDLREGGLHLNPYFDRKLEVNKVFLNRVNLAIPFLSKSESGRELSASLLARKLTEIKSVYPALANALLAGIELYSWRETTSIIDIKDEDPIIDIPKEKQIQLAGRRGKEIFVDSNLWKKLDPENSAALIIHEIVYAWIKPSKRNDHFEQRSDYARSVVRYLFSRDFSIRGRSAFNIYVKNLNFPIFPNFNKVEVEPYVSYFLIGEFGFKIEVINTEMYPNFIERNINFKSENGADLFSDKIKIIQKDFCDVVKNLENEYYIKYRIESFKQILKSEIIFSNYPAEDLSERLYLKVLEPSFENLKGHRRNGSLQQEDLLPICTEVVTEMAKNVI